MRDPIPIPPKLSYWVIPGKFLAGAYSSHPEAAIGRKRLQQFLSIGINSFVSLMRIDEKGMHGIPKEDYESLLYEIAATMGLHVTFKRFPIPDGSVCSKQELVEILNYVDDLLNKDRKIYLHCWSGCGRTGMVAACFLARRGLSGEQSLQRIEELRNHDDELRMWPLSLSAQQIQMVRQWNFCERSMK